MFYYSKCLTQKRVYMDKKGNKKSQRKAYLAWNK